MTEKKTSAARSSAQSSANNKAAAMMDAGGEGNVDKIRDILFGSQMKDYERKFLRLEERLVKEVTRTKDDLTKRIDTLESYLKKEMESINDRLKQEKTQRTEAVKELNSEHKKTTKLLEDKLTALDEQLGTISRELRMQILEQSKALTGDITLKQQEATDALDRTAAELRDEKVDRTSMSELLTEMAIRLASENSMDSELDHNDIE